MIIMMMIIVMIKCPCSPMYVSVGVYVCMYVHIYKFSYFISLNWLENILTKETGLGRIG